MKGCWLPFLVVCLYLIIERAACSHFFSMFAHVRYVHGSSRVEQKLSFALSLLQCVYRVLWLHRIADQCV
jgi:hypothetical protein